MKMLTLSLILTMPLFASAHLVTPLLDCATRKFPVEASATTVLVNHLTQNNVDVMTVTRTESDEDDEGRKPMKVRQSHERVESQDSKKFGDPSLFKGSTYTLSVNLSAAPYGGAYPAELTTVATGERLKILCTAK